MNEFEDIKLSEPAPTQRVKKEKVIQYRDPTPDEVRIALIAVAWDINMHMQMTHNKAAVADCNQRVSDWVEAHALTPGLSAEENRLKLNYAFWTRVVDRPELRKAAEQ